MTDDEELTAATYVQNYAWSCPECGETHDLGDVDEAGTEQACEGCGATVRLT